MLDEYGDEIEADLRETYGVDLLDMFRGKLAPLTVYRMVSQLGQTSRLARAATGPAGSWTHEMYLMANIVDLLASANWQRGGGKGPKPKPLKRPGSDKKIRTGSTTLPQAEVKAYLDRLHNRSQPEE